MLVRAFDDHIARGVDVNPRRVTRVGFHEPNYDGDIVSDALIDHRNSTVGLKKVN